MATALTSAQLQRPQHEVLDGVVRRTRGFRTSTMRVRPAATLLGCLPTGITSESRGRMIKVSPLRTGFSTRKGQIRAMSEGEHDITEIQETDKVSGEWWQPVLSAVHDWSKEKLSGLAELADGSLFFSFGKSATPTDAAAQPRIQQSESADVTVPTQNLTPGVLLQRHPSSFRKKSPIPAAARSRRTASKAEVDTAELGAAEIKETLVDSATSKTATPERPERPVSSFSKKSPIPKNRDGSGVSSSKRRSSGEVGSVVEAPSKPKFTKRSPISRNRNSNRATRSEKKSDPTEAAPQEVASKSEKKSDSTEATPQEVASKSEKKSDPTEAAPQEVASKSEKRSDSTELTPEEAVSRSEKKSDPTEVAPEEVASRSEKKSDPTEVAPEEVASRSEKKSNSSGAATAEVASSQPEPVVYESDSDLPVSPELREVLNDGKHTAGAEAEEDVKSSSVSVAKTKSSKQSKVVIEDNEVAQSEAVENGAASKDLSSYKLPELRSMAKAKGLKGYSKLKKGELVDLIAASEVS